MSPVPPIGALVVVGLFFFSMALSVVYTVLAAQHRDEELRKRACMWFKIVLVEAPLMVLTLYVTIVTWDMGA